MMGQWMTNNFPKKNEEIEEKEGNWNQMETNSNICLLSGRFVSSMKMCQKRRKEFQTQPFASEHNFICFHSDFTVVVIP